MGDRVLNAPAGGAAVGPFGPERGAAVRSDHNEIRPSAAASAMSLRKWLPANVIRSSFR